MRAIQRFALAVMFAVVAALGMVSSASATGPDLTALTSAVSFDTVVVAIVAIAGLLAVVYVARKGAVLGLSMLRR